MLKQAIKHVSTVTMTAVLGMTGCARLPAVGREMPVPVQWQSGMRAGACVAVLPFFNQTGRADIAATVRQSFYNHFSSKKFYDIELQDCDRGLKKAEGFYGRPWRAIAPAALGKFLKADYLIYGEATRFKTIYLGLYSQLALGVHVTIFESPCAKPVWEETVLQRSHQVGLPLNPVSFLFESVRCGIHLQQEHIEDLVERVCRNIVARIPNPGPPADMTSVLQAASFLTVSRATALKSDLQKSGYPAFCEKPSIAGTRWYRVLVGPLSGADADAARHDLHARFKLQPFVLHRNSRPQN